MSIYDFSAPSIDGRDVPLAEFKGKVILIVNTASGCGFTPQYRGLEELYQSYKDQGFAVLGFPCNQFGQQEKGSEEEIKSFCELNFGIKFPLFAKVDVKGPSAHPLYRYLVKAKPGILGLEDIKWNFTKFLVNRQGQVVKRYAPTTDPKSIKGDIEDLLRS